MNKSVAMLGVALLVSSALVFGAFAQIRPQLPAPGEAPAGSPVAKHGQLKASGSKILDKDNNPVTLRGMSLFWANTGAGGQYFNESVVGWLVHDWKVSVIRAPIGVAKTDGEGDGKFNGNAGYTDGDSSGMVNKAITVIEECIKRGVYVVVDWHTHNKGEAAGKSAKGAEFLGNIAKMYGAYPNVLFEPFNEPMEGNDGVASYVNPIITRIRTSSQNLIIVGSSEWSRNPNGVNVSGTNIAFSYHFYSGTHKLDGGDGSGKVNSALSANKAVLVTEFGTSNANGDGGPFTDETDRWITWLETNKVGWMNWSICHLTEKSAALTAAGGSGGPWSLSTSGTWVRNKILGYNGKDYYPTSTYSVTVTAGEGGKVEKKVGNTVKDGPYNYKDVVSVKATPNAGWEVQEWTGDASGFSDSMATTILGVNLKMGVKFYNGGIIKNGHFTHNTGSWNSSGNVLLTPQPAATLARDGSQLKVTVSQPGESISDLFVFQNGIKLEQGRKYKLSFEAKGASARKIVAKVSNGRSASSTTYATIEKDLTTTMTPYEETFNMGSTITNGRLDFEIGGSSAGVFITNVRLLDVGAGTGVARGAAHKPAVGSWSVANVGGEWRLRGPAEAGARVSLYDTRGKLLKSMSAADGLAIGGAGISAGNYLIVVKNSSGAEVLRSKIVMAR
jgi:endoglucanase